MLTFGKLRAYQREIIEHIVDHPRCAIYSPMGSGKTAATLTALHMLHAIGDCGPTLVLAPQRVARSTWPVEVGHWEHLHDHRTVPVLGTPATRRLALRIDAPVYTINYENLPWLIDHFGDRWPFTTIVADESTKLKSFRGSLQESKTGKEFLRGGGGLRARALAKIAHSHVKRFIQLSGTPAPNGLIDLWGQIWFLDGGKRLGRTFTAFQQRWFTSTGPREAHSPLVARPGAEEEIANLLRDICLTVDLSKHFPVDKPIVTEIRVQLPVSAQREYADMARKLYTELRGAPPLEAMNAAAKTQKLLQLGNGAVYVEPSADTDAHPKAKAWHETHNAKVLALIDIIEESAGAPVLVAYQFRSDLERLLKAIPQARVLDKNPKTIDEWNRGAIPVLLAHPASAGHGLNLQHGGNILVYFSHDWNLEQRDQMLERIGPLRQLQSGYKRPVFVYYIIADNTLDDVVLERVAGKRDIQATLLAAWRKQYGG